MKKLISILLVAMLIIGMFPATALTAFAEETTETISFTSTAQRKSQTTASQVWENGNLRFTNNKGSSTTNVANYSNPVRIYGKSEMILECTNGANITTIAFKTNTGSDYVASLKATLDACEGTYTVSGDTYTLTLDNPTPTFTFTNASTKQIRLYSITVACEAGGSTEPDEPDCTHEGYDTYEGDDGKAATCLENGQTATVYCSNCKGVVSESTVITAPGSHNYVNGICDREGCGAIEPVAPEIPKTGYYKEVTSLADVTAGGKFVIVAVYNGKNYAMNLEIDSKIKTTEVEVVGDSIVAEDISTLPGWVVVPADGGIALQSGEKYLAYGTSGTNFISNTSAYKWTVEGSDTFRIKATTGPNRAVGFQNSGIQFGGYSTTNSSGYVFDLKLYKLTEGEAEVVESTLTFVEDGTTSKTEVVEATTTYTMPAAQNAVPSGWTFAGWVEAQVKETALAPETVYAAGSSYTVGNDATFYALYTRSEEVEGETATAYVAKDISEINTGDTVVITMTNSSGTVYAIPNATTSSSPSVTKVTVSEGKLVGDVDTVNWDIEKTEEGMIFYVHGSTTNSLYCTNSNTGVRVGKSDVNVFVIDKDYLMNTKTTDDRYIGVYNNADWRCYKLSSGAIADNIKGQTLTFYALSSVSGTVVTNYYTTCASHKYESANATTLVCAYCGTEKAAPVNVGGVAYESVQAAAAAGTVVLNQNVENITVTGELSLDLNGKKAGITADKIYASDSTAKVSAEGAGSLTVAEGTEVVTDNTVNGVRYIALNNEGTYTFHVLELKLSAISLRTSAAGIYYKAEMNCDDQLRAATDCHGMVLSVENMPGADFANEEDNNGWTKVDGAPAEGNMTSCSVFNIFVDGDDDAVRGATKIYANAYLQLKGTGEIIMADTANVGNDKNTAGFNGIAWSLNDVMVALNNSFTTMDDEAKKASIVKFYETWSDAMSGWGLTNIAAAATSAQ